jgi:hypothetical protein
VNDSSDRHRSQRHCVAWLDVNLGARNNAIANGEALRSQDVGKMPIRILDERDERRAVGIVFQTLDDARHIELAALEVDHAVRLLVPAADVARGDAAVNVASARFLLALNEHLDRRALPQARTVNEHQLAHAGRRWTVCF